MTSFRFQRAFSPGLQEYLEAVSLMEYLQNQKLLSIEKAQEDLLKSNTKVRDVILSPQMTSDVGSHLFNHANGLPSWHFRSDWRAHAVVYQFCSTRKI